MKPSQTPEEPSGRLLTTLAKHRGIAEKAAPLLRLPPDAKPDTTISLTLLQPGAEGSHRSVQVHPKRLDVFNEIKRLSAELGRAQAQLLVLEAHAKSKRQRRLAAEVTAELDYYLRLVAWIMCCEGPGLPFSDEEPRPQLPAWVAALEPLDLARICVAYEMANRSQLPQAGQED